MGDETVRPHKWRRLTSPSSRLVRIDPADPCYNFNFLGLPLEIKLLIICRYLSLKDILNMSLISKDYRQFIDRYFLRKEVVLPSCLDDFGDLREKRYVLSLKVDFDEKAYSEDDRESTLEVIVCLNLSKMRRVSLVYDKADSTRLVHDFDKDESFMRTFMSICPYYAEISECVFENAMYLESVDFTMFKCESSFMAIHALSKNASRLRKVTLRSPEEFVYHTSYGLTAYVAKLLNKTAVTHLELVNFHKFTIWSETRAQFSGLTLLVLVV